MNRPVTGNVLNNANVPAGATASVTGFSISGSAQVYSPGSNVTLPHPVTGLPIGTLQLSSTGAYTFEPLPSYVGPSPAINVYSSSSDGQTAVSSLTVDVLTRERRLQMGCMHAWGMLCACARCATGACASPCSATTLAQPTIAGAAIMHTMQ
jgi:hypothetical protein